MKKLIQDSIKEALKKMNIEKDIILTDPKKFGDYSSNIALSLKNDLNKNPMDIAKEIVENIDQKKYMIQKIEIINPGFINFFLDSKIITYILSHFANNDFMLIDVEKKSYNIEFVSANPTGFLHIGHARGAAVGDTLCNVLEFAGHKITREYYINDAGNQINKLALSLFTRYQQELGNSEIQLPEDSYHGEDIIYFAKEFIKLYGDKYKDHSFETDIQEFFKEEGTKLALNKIKSDLSLFRVHFDFWSSEKSCYPLIDDALAKLEGIYESDGAKWLDTTKHGDDKDRVLVKSDGTYTYFTPDLAYHYLKKTKNNGGSDYLIDLLGSDHIGYVKRMQIALLEFGFPIDTLSVVILELVRLIKNGKELKMSKRAGNTITLIDLIDLIGIDAARYFLIERSNSAKIDLDIDKISVQNMNNSIFIIQYAYVRALSILNKSTIELSKASDKWKYDNKYELTLINTLKEFPELINTISKNFKIHLLAQYLVTLSKDFNSFYSNSKILDSQDESKLILLVKATKNILEKGMNLIKITVHERM